MIRTALTEQLGIEAPIIQAPMGGGPTTPELVTAVSNAGGLGSVAGGYLAADALAAEIAHVRRLTDRPFAVNIFAPHHIDADEHVIERAQQLLAPLRRELGLRSHSCPTTSSPTFDDQLRVLLDARPPVVSFTFGRLPHDAITALHKAGCVLIGTATSVAEAIVLEQDGIDVICGQGAEAGAHRGSFLTDPLHALVGTMVLTPLIVDAVSVPVVAAGGIMDGRGVAAAVTLGAAAAQLGTAFLRCPEAGTTPVHRTALAEADETSTVVTDALTGRAARAIDNRLVRELHGHDVPAYPVMNELTGELRKAAASRGRADLTSLWAGQGAAMGTGTPAAQLVAVLTTDAAARIQQLAQQCR